MNTKCNLGIFGCGDFLRWQADALQTSQRVQVAALYDPDRARAEAFANQVGGRAVVDGEEIFADPEIDIICLFVPPWLRRPLFDRAVAAGKHVLATKPVASSIADAEAMVSSAEGKVRCGVFYGRTGDRWAEGARALFESGEVGRLALYKQDWLHHYPMWNNWALDPVKNGGPFMDAMIHNLNLARYLMGRPLTAATWFSERLSHPDIPCADTEMVKADFEAGGAAYLFITWAADLEVFNNTGNNRDHIDLFYMVSDQGWHLTKMVQDKCPGIFAKRNGEERFFAFPPLAATAYDRFIEAVESGAPNPGDVPDLAHAAFDIRLVRTLGEKPFNHITL